jgi:diadenosine tetraphosphate (Ap4A) HIT family hydrolase
MSPDNPGCDFCDEFSNGHDNAFAARYGEEMQDRTVLSTENFRVLPSIGQIVEGYIMVVPTAHYVAMGDLPVGLVEELRALLAFVRKALTETYGNCVLFEHGARNDTAGGCGIYHAHLHAVPLVNSTDPIHELRKLHSLIEIDGLDEIGPTTSGHPYLYYEALDGRRYVSRVDQLQSQYMRRFIARLVGKSEWNWREAGKEPGLCSVAIRLSSWFALHSSPSESLRIS